MAACSKHGALEMKYDRGDGKVNRRVILALSSLPLLGLRKAEAMTEAEELAKLQVEAARIQEIIDVQKAGNSNLPSLRDSQKFVKSAPKLIDEISPVTVSGNIKTDMTNVQQVVTSLMSGLQTEGEKGMELVLANSAEGNPFKTMPYQKVCDMMRDTSLAVLFGHFTKFEIMKPLKIAPDDQGRVRNQVDVLVKAPYQTMLQHGMQFNDIIMGTSEDMLCTATFRWKMRQGSDGKWLNLGCVVVDPINA